MGGAVSPDGAVQTDLEQNADDQPAIDTQWEGLDPIEPLLCTMMLGEEYDLPT